MRAILIEPGERRVSVNHLDPTPRELRRICGGTPRVVATLPNGDVLLAAQASQAEPGFSVGGTTAVRATGIILGRPDAFRTRKDAKSRLDSLDRLTRWVEGQPDIPDGASTG